MKRQRLGRHLAHALLAAAGALLLAPFAAADGDIVKCIGAEGRITLTDTACQAGERSVTVVPGVDAAAPQTAAPAAAPVADSVARTVALARKRHLAPTLARTPLGRLDPPSRSLARGVATLKAARQAMTLMDAAAASMRHRRLAGLH